MFLLFACLGPLTSLLNTLLILQYLSKLLCLWVLLFLFGVLLVFWGFFYKGLFVPWRFMGTALTKNISYSTYHIFFWLNKCSFPNARFEKVAKLSIFYKIDASEPCLIWKSFLTFWFYVLRVNNLSRKIPHKVKISVPILLFKVLSETALVAICLRCRLKPY